MNEHWIIAGLLAVCWGIVWACVLQFTSWGRWAAIKRTWLTVVVGVVGTFLCGLVVFDWLTLFQVGSLFALSGIGIIARSLYNEMREDR